MHLFEIEFRCHFSNNDEAYKALPFLSSCLKGEKTWVDTFYGLGLFKSGQVLRISDVFIGDETRYYLGWKGPDIGKFANIRQELNEEVTNSITNSAIMEWIVGTQRPYTYHEIIQELEQLGHHRFMSYQGKNLVGRYEPFDIDVKLMTCPVLKWPLLVEVEKMTITEKEAIQCQQDLRELCSRFQLESSLIRKEPPSLLYAATFGHECDGR